MIRHVALLALAAAFSGACSHAAAQGRPDLKEASSVRIANYGSPSTLIKDRGDVRAIVEELKALREKPWRRGDAKLSCYSSVMLMKGAKMIALYRVTPDQVVERALEKGESSFTLIVGAGDMPVLSKALSEIAPAKCR